MIINYHELLCSFPQDNELVLGSISYCISPTSNALYWSQVLETEHQSWFSTLRWIFGFWQCKQHYLQTLTILHFIHFHFSIPVGHFALIFYFLFQFKKVVEEFLVFLILYNYVIPISLYVTVGKLKYWNMTVMCATGDDSLTWHDEGIQCSLKLFLFLWQNYRSS